MGYKFEFEQPSKLKARFGLSSETLRLYAEQYFLKGIHFIILPGGHRRYNVLLVADWLINQDDPSAHQRAIDHFQQSLPSNQSLKRRSTPKS